jgi:hypothetical protein
MGARGAGKTSTAKAICDRYANFVRFSFAEPVRTEAFQLIKAESLRDPMVAKWLHAVGDPFAHKTKDTPIWGMEVTPRDLLIEVGENARRQDPTYWIRKIRQQIAETTAHVVIDDVRFTPEHRFIQELNGALFQVGTEEPDGDPFKGSGLLPGHEASIEQNAARAVVYAVESQCWRMV